jgi:fatty acid/phospholipid biosynthesis enzyme
LLLGINGTALICHGASESRTIRNAIMAAKKYHSVGINDKIAKYLLASSVVDEGQNAEPEDAALRVKDEQVD